MIVGTRIGGGRVASLYHRVEFMLRTGSCTSIHIHHHNSPSRNFHSPVQPCESYNCDKLESSNLVSVTLPLPAVGSLFFSCSKISTAQHHYAGRSFKNNSQFSLTSSFWRRYFSTYQRMSSELKKPDTRKEKSPKEISVSADVDEVLRKQATSSTSLFRTLTGKREAIKVSDDWQTVYRFTQIRIAGVIQRLKIYQTAFTCCILLPGSIGCYLTNEVSMDAVEFVLCCSILACGMLYVMGNFCSKLVGIVYVSKTDRSLVRVAHMNFWGMRQDLFFNKSDFVPLSELPDNAMDAYVNVKFYSDPDFQLRISFRYGQVFDKEQFEQIFGSASGIYLKQISAEKDEKSVPPRQK